MSSQLVIRLYPDQGAAADPASVQASWIRLESENGPSPITNGPLAEAANHSVGARVIVLVPGDDILLTEVSIPSQNRQRILKALPFALEDRLVSDVDAMHFAAGARSEGGAIPVCAVSRKKMEHWQEILNQAGIFPHYLMADIYALPSEDKAWNILPEEHRTLVRVNGRSGFVLDDPSTEIMLNMALRESQEDAPEKLTFWMKKAQDFQNGPASELTEDPLEDTDSEIQSAETKMTANEQSEENVSEAQPMNASELVTSPDSIVDETEFYTDEDTVEGEDETSVQSTSQNTEQSPDAMEGSTGESDGESSSSGIDSGEVSGEVSGKNQSEGEIVSSVPGFEFLVADGISLHQHFIEKGLLGAVATQGSLDLGRAINLLQGDFSRKERIGKFFRPWRVTAILALIWFVLEWGMMVYEGVRLEGEEERLKAQVETLYKQAFPDARKVIRPKIQMERKLQELRGGGGAKGGFLNLLSSTGVALQQHKNITLKSIRYKNGVLDVELQTPSLQMIDQLKQQLTQDRGLDVEIQSAQQRDNLVEGRLNIKAENVGGKK